MIPIIQTKVVILNSKGEPVVRGNCYAAAIASLLELPITEIPNVEIFFNVPGYFWYEVMTTFLYNKGYELFCDDRYKVFHPELEHQLRPTEDFDEWVLKTKEELKDKYYLITGTSPRGNFNHITIWQNGKMVHDPHPTNEGILDLVTFQSLEKIKK